MNNNYWYKHDNQLKQLMVEIIERENFTKLYRGHVPLVKKIRKFQFGGKMVNAFLGLPHWNITRRKKLKCKKVVLFSWLQCPKWIFVFIDKVICFPYQFQDCDEIKFHNFFPDRNSKLKFPEFSF